jgi:hypothetical protein
MTARKQVVFTLDSILTRCELGSRRAVAYDGPWGVPLHAFESTSRLELATHLGFRILVLTHQGFRPFHDLLLPRSYVDFPACSFSSAQGLVPTAWMSFQGLRVFRNLELGSFPQGQITSLPELGNALRDRGVSWGNNLQV